MHDMHLYLKYTNSYALFSNWKTVVTLHTANPIFHKLVCISRKGPRKQELPKGAEKMGVGE